MAITSIELSISRVADGHITNLPLAQRNRVPPRYLPSDSLADVEPLRRRELRAVVAVAAPSAALDGREGRPLATLANLTTALRGDAPIIFLAYHSALVEGEPYL